jgi:hypothetical protein
MKYLLYYWNNRCKIILNLVVKSESSNLYNNIDVYIKFIVNYYKCCNINNYGFPYMYHHITRFKLDYICESPRLHNHCSYCGKMWSFNDIDKTHIFKNINDISVDMKNKLLSIDGDLVIDIINNRVLSIQEKVDLILAINII